MKNWEFNDYWNHFHPRILVYTARMTGLPYSECEDLVQDIFLKAYGGWERVVPSRGKVKSPRASWIYAIARNYLIDWFRHQNRIPKKINSSFSLEGVPSSLGTPEELAVANILKTTIDIHLSQLKESDREIAFFKFSEGMRDGQIGKLMDLPVGTVKYRIHQIRAGLKKYLEVEYES